VVHIQPVDDGLSLLDDSRKSATLFFCRLPSFDQPSFDQYGPWSPNTTLFLLYSRASSSMMRAFSGRAPCGSAGTWWNEIRPPSTLRQPIFYRIVATPLVLLLPLFPRFLLMISVLSSSVYLKQAAPLTYVLNVSLILLASPTSSPIERLIFVVGVYYHQQDVCFVDAPAV
jgi:hypothetical protein